MMHVPGEPVEKASCFLEGTKKRGEDGNEWIVEVTWEGMTRVKSVLGKGTATSSWRRVTDADQPAKRARAANCASVAATPAKRAVRELQDWAIPGPKDVPNSFLPRDPRNNKARTTVAEPASPLVHAPVVQGAAVNYVLVPHVAPALMHANPPAIVAAQPARAVDDPPVAREEAKLDLLKKQFDAGRITRALYEKKAEEVLARMGI